METPCYSAFGIYVNISDPQTAKRWLWSETDEYIFKMVLPIVLSVGVIGNLVFLFTVLRLKRMRTVTNIYLSHLAVADVLFLLVSCGVYTWTYFESPISHNTPLPSSFSCGFVFFVIYLCYFASVSIVTMVSVERYYAICSPIKHRTISSKSRTLKILAGLWFTASVLAAGSTPRFGRLKMGCLIWPQGDEFLNMPTHFYDCFKINRQLFLFSETIQGFSFLISFTISLFTYVNIILNLADRDVGIDTNDIITKQNKLVRNQVARMLIANGMIFFFCQSPYRVVSVNSIIQEFQGNDILNKDGLAAILLVVSRGLLFLNSAVNPYLYALTSSFYRHAFRQALCGTRKSRIEKAHTVSVSINYS